MPTDVIIDPSTGQIYWNDNTGSPQSISIKGDALNAISITGYSASFSPGSSVGGTTTLVTFNDNSGTDALVPGTTGFNLGSSTLRWNTFATNANLSGTLVVSDSTISSSLLTGSVRFNGGIAISGNASIGQSLNFYNTTNSNIVGFRAGITAANTIYTLPTNFPGSGTSVLQSDTTGVLTWVGIVGNATTSQNINVVSATTSASHPVLFTPATGTVSGAAVSSNSTLVYNPFTDILSVSGLAVTSGAISTSTTSGAFQVRGGIGITGNAFIGGTINVGSPITIPNGGTNVSSFGQSAGFVYYDGANVRLLAASGATINFTNGYYQFDNRVYATSFFAGGNQMPNGSGIAGRVTIWSGNNTIGSDAEFTYDTTNNILSVSGNINSIGFTASGVAITSGTASTSTATGALIVAGGVGISGRLTFNQASLGTTGITTVPTMAMIGQTGDPIFMSVLEDNSISFEGSQGQLFSISPNLTTGYIWSVNDISGVPFLRSSVGGTIGIAEFGGVVGIGQTNPIYKLDVRGNFGLASSNDNTYSFIFSNTATTGNNSLQIRSANSILLYNSGNTFYTGFKSSASQDVTYTLPPTAGSSGQFLQTNGSGTLSWATASGGSGSGSSGVNPGGEFEIGYYAATGASISGSSTFKNNTTTNVVSVTHSTASTSFGSGALTVTGGVGIGGSLYVGGTGSSISGVRILNGTINSGTWNGTVIGVQYGGTGQNLTGLSGILTISGGTVSNSTTSSAIASALTDETGSGSLVFNSQPSFGTGVTTGDGTFAVFNTNATTINAFGAATTISLGASSGTVTFNSTNNTTAANTGAVVFSGGVGIGRSVSVGGRLLLFNGSTYTGFVSNQVGTGSTVYILPPRSPESAVGTSVLSSAIDGTMSWVPMVASGGAGSGTVAIPDAQFRLAFYAGTGASVSSTNLITAVGTGVSILGATNASSTTVAALTVVGGLGVASNAFIGGTTTIQSSQASVSTTSGALVVTGGVGIGGSLYTGSSPSSISGVVLNNGFVTSGTWAGSVITSLYGGTGFNSYSVGDILYAASGTSLARLPANTNVGYVLTSNGANAAPSYQAVPPAAASSVAVAPTVLDQSFFITTTSTSSGSGLGLSTITSFVVNPFTRIVTVSGLAVTATTQTTNASTGALIVTNGAAVGQTLSVGGSLNIFNGANYTGFRFSGSASTTYTLPTRTPTGTGTSFLSSGIDGVMAWVAAPTGGSATPGGSNKQIQYNNSTAFGGASGFEYTTGGIAVTVSVFSPSGTGYTSGLWIQAINGSTTRVGIGLSNPAFELEINGEISATNKSFVIDHPTKDGMKLRYGSLEGPENGVYVRGELKNSNIIEVPDHWLGLVHPDSYTVHLTPIGRYAQLYVEKIENYNVYVADNNMNPINCYYSVWAERKDIPKLITEYEAQ